MSMFVGVMCTCLYHMFQASSLYLISLRINQASLFELLCCWPVTHNLARLYNRVVFAHTGRQKIRRHLALDITA